MAIINFVGFESGSSSLESYTSSGVTISSAQARTGTYSLQCNPVTTGTVYQTYGPIESDGTNGDGSPGFGNNVIVKFHLYVATLPSANEEMIAGGLQGSGATRTWELRLTSTGTLKLYDSVPTLIGTSSALSTATWYCIEVKWGTSASVATLELKINEVVSVTTTTANTTGAGTGRMFLGKIANLNGVGYDCYFDDLIICDTTTGYLGANPVVKLLDVDSNGSTMQWTSGTGSSNYAEVNEIPLSSATYVKSNGSASQVALFDCESTSTAGISGTILAVKGAVRVLEDTGTPTSSNSIRIRSNVTNSDSTARDLTTTASASLRLLENDPDTAAAWTTGGLDAIEVGSIENNAVAVRMQWAGVFVLYTPSGGGGGATGNMLEVF